MGRIERDFFGDGYTVYHDDGTKERFHKAVFSDDMIGDAGTRHYKTLTGLDASMTRDGKREVFRDALLSDDKIGSRGTRISPDFFGDGYTVHEVHKVHEVHEPRDYSSSNSPASFLDTHGYSGGYGYGPHSQETTHTTWRDTRLAREKMERQYKDRLPLAIVAIVVEFFILLAAISGYESGVTEPLVCVTVAVTTLISTFICTAASCGQWSCVQLIVMPLVVPIATMSSIGFGNALGFFFVITIVEIIAAVAGTSIEKSAENRLGI